MRTAHLLTLCWVRCEGTTACVPLWPAIAPLAAVLQAGQQCKQLVFGRCHDALWLSQGMMHVCTKNNQAPENHAGATL